MNKIFGGIFSRYLFVSKLLLILGCVIVITLIVPKKVQFRYNFEEGKPWKYESLLAPFDFSIYKTRDQLQEERRSMLSDFIPYYNILSEIPDSVQRSFRRALEREIILKREMGEILSPRDSIRLFQAGSSCLESIYQKGILSGAPPDSFQIQHEIIYLMRGNVAERRNYREFYELSEAKRSVSNILALSLQPDQLFIQPLLTKLLKANIVYNSSLNGKLLEEELIKISPKFGKVNEGEKIIFQGEIVTAEKYQLLQSLKEEVEKNRFYYNDLIPWAGYFIIFALLFLLFGFYLFMYAIDVFKNQRRLLVLLLFMFAMIALTVYCVKQQLPSLYVLPFCIIPIVLRPFWGSRLAFFTHLTVVLTVSFIVPYGPEFIFLQIVAGMVAILSNQQAHYWSQFFISIIYIYLTYIAGFTGYSLIKEGNLSSIPWNELIWFGVNAFLTLLAYPLIPVFERLFGIISEFTLVELTDMNNPLLKELIMKAPGTAQHSQMVANLSEAATREIKGNSLLAKVGCLYHDIGKMANPQFFTENQQGNFNPHDKITSEQSAKVIIDHVVRGVEMARKNRIPEIVIDFIRTHHGTTRTEYFFRREKIDHPESEVDPSLYQYPGPLPSRKEHAVVMMADSIEAAARSLSKPSAEAIDELVDRLIQEKMDGRQFVKAEITFKEISTVKKVFKKMLKSVYHARIEYPRELSATDQVN